MTFFDKLPFIGKEIIVQTLDTFSYALSRRWTILVIPHPVPTDVISDLMNHMSNLLLSAFETQNGVRSWSCRHSEYFSAQAARINK